SSVNCVAPSGEGVPAVPRRIPSFTPSRSNAWFPAADEIGARGSDDATMASVAKATSEIRRHARLDVRVIDASLTCSRVSERTGGGQIASSGHLVDSDVVEVDRHRARR